jgi:hypothetical protein
MTSRALLPLLLLALAARPAAAADPPVLAFPPMDAAALIERDEERSRVDRPRPLQFAEPIEMLATARTDGAWEARADGSSEWQLTIQVPGATDLNFGFRRFDVAPGAELFVSEPSGRFVLGPYGPDDAGAGQLWTALVPGDTATIRLTLPPGAPEPILELSQVGAGYRGLGDPLAPRPMSGSCNNDVACPEAAPWSNEVRSAVKYTYQGFETCSGTLIADVPRSFRPFILSAEHCDIDPAFESTIVTYWSFQASTCGGARDGAANTVSQSGGAILRAENVATDMVLFELAAPPVAGSNAWWSGWDRSDVAPASSVAIHHPSLDEKAITFDADPLTRSENCIQPPGAFPDTHWYVTQYEDGTTEAGSSGSGIWDEATHLLVGTLSGGWASCSAVTNGNPDDDFDCWGRFGRQWDAGATAAGRLRDWLDPAGTGATSVPGGAPATAAVELEGWSFTDACSLGHGNGNGLAEPGETLTLVPRLVATSGLFTNVRAVLDSAGPVTLVDANATWPDLGAAPQPSDAPHLRLTIGTAAACGDALDFTLRVTTAEGGPFDLALSLPVGDPGPSPDAPMAIPDSGTASSAMDVTTDVTLTDVRVRAVIDHPHVGHLRLRLRSPAGTTVLLMDRPGDLIVPGGCDGDDMDITFTDASAFDPESTCTGATPWYAGLARPVAPLSTFAGESTLGTWTLLVSDVTTGSVGTLQDWELVTSPSLAGGCDACADTCLGQVIADAPPNVLLVSKGPSGSVVLRHPPASSSCATGVQVRMSPRSRPSAEPGSFPTDPPFADVTSQDLDPGAPFRHVPPPGLQHYLVVEDLAGTPGPSGSYGN